MNAPHVSIIIPLLNEEENITQLWKETVAIVEGMGIPFEIILADDGSTDSTAERIHALVRGDPRVRGIHLRHNTRKAGALEAGFSIAQGEIIITMDGDLQDDPSGIPALFHAVAEGADVAVGWRKERQDSIGKIYPSYLINLLANIVLRQRFHDMNSGFKAYKRTVIEHIPFHGSLFRFIPHLLHIEGFKVQEVPVHHRKRTAGTSKFSLEHRIRGMLDLCTVFFLTRYGNRPLHFFGMLGGILFVLGFINFAYLMVIWWNGVGIGGRPLLLFSLISMVIGIQIASIGFIGELLLYNIRMNPKNGKPAFTVLQ